MKSIFMRIRHWYWWNFKATDQDKIKWDTMTTGSGIMVGGKRIYPRRFYGVDHGMKKGDRTAIVSGYIKNGIYHLNRVIFKKHKQDDRT